MTGTEEVPMSALVQSVDYDGDVVAALHALFELRRQADRREALLIKRAQARGLTWAEIAVLLGVSKQAVHKRYGGSRRETRRA